MNQELLHQLTEHGACGLKAGFEAEAQDLEDVVRMSGLDPALPLTVKIGGADARTDLRNLVDWSIYRVVAPMIESPFAVLKVMQNATATVGEDLSALDIGLNLESVSAYNARREILGCEAAAAVARVNVGRSDLSASLALPVESAIVLEMTQGLLQQARATGKRTGVGGSIRPATIEALLSACEPDEFETRHVIFDTSKVRDAAAAVKVALQFELALIEWLDAPRMHRLKQTERRSGVLKSRFSHAGPNGAARRVVP